MIESIPETLNGARGQRPEADRLRELILYIAERSQADQYFGLTKLNKLLFFSDFRAFAELGRSITGYQYLRFNQGPVPRRGNSVVKDMAGRGKITLDQIDFFGHVQTRVNPRCSANLAMFSIEEISIVDEEITRYWDYSAAEIANQSHQFAGWRLAKNQEPIPYAVALIRTDPEITEFASATAQRIARQLVAAR